MTATPAVAPSGRLLQRCSPERELLLRCARRNLDRPGLAHAEALAAHDLDWDAFAADVARHRVLPLVFRSLCQVGSAVPPLVLDRFARAFHANARRNLFLTAELLQVLECLRKEGIPCMPYKGPALAVAVYGDLALRQFADLDVIVPRQHVVRARALLVSRSYRPEKPLTDAELRSCLGSEKDITLLSTDGRINLEVHWGITTDRDPIRLEPSWLWRHPASCAIGGRQLPVLPIEQLLPILCIHGAKHFWERLAWICDIAEIVASQAIDWDVVQQNAARIGASRMLLLGLGLASELLGAAPPARIQEAITADRVLAPLGAQIRSWLFEGTAAGLDLGERERYFMRLRERRTDRCRVALTQAKHYLTPTRRDREALPLPQCLRWSLYLVRPLRLAGVYGFAPLKRFLNGLFQS